MPWDWYMNFLSLLTCESLRVSLLNNKALSQSKRKEMLDTRVGWMWRGMTYSFCYVSENRFFYWFLGSFLKLIEAGRHQFHANPHISFVDETSQALNDVGAVMRLQHDIQVHCDSFCLLIVASSAHLLKKIPIRIDETDDRDLARLTLTAIIAALGLCLILTTWPLVPLPSSSRYSKSFTFVS